MTDNIGWGDAPTTTSDPLPTYKQHILSWVDAVSVRNQAIEAEREWRQRVKADCFPNAVRGTQRFDLKNGYKLKLQQSYTYKLGDRTLIDPATNQLIPINKQVEDLQLAIEDLGNEGPMLSDRLIRWKPEIVESEYRKLNVEFPVEKAAKDLIDAILTITEGSPQMELEEPKT